MDHSFLFSTFVFLCAAVVAVPISKRLGLGSVLGYLIAGVLIGPSVLSMIKQPEAILHFSEFGVVILMFLIGLELQPSHLWHMRRTIFGFGAIQVASCWAVLGITFWWALDVSWQVSFIVTLGFALSSTAMVLQTLNEKNLTATPAGQSCFGVLLFQDLAVIPILAMIPMLGHSVTGSFSWLAALKMAGVLAAVLLGGRVVLRHGLRYVAATGQREIFTGFALLIVIGIALLMQSVHLSMALGTFIAGMLLADSEYRHELEIDLEPFKGLLLGLFFISVGMSLDLSIFAEHGGMVIGWALGLMVTKLVILALIGKVGGLDTRSNGVFAFFLCQAGEFGFVLFSLGKSVGVLSAELSTIATAIVALSMLLTPVLLIFHDRVVEVRLARVGPDRPVSENFDEAAGSVVVCGFGRVGQIVARILHARGFDTILLDHDPSHIEMVAGFGFKVFYGDVTRLQLLESAGVAKASLVVMAIDNPEPSTEAVKMIRENFPHVPIIARSRNRNHAMDLLSLGAQQVVRETFGSSLELAEMSLTKLGFHAYEAHRSVQMFARYDRSLLKKSVAVRDDHKSLESLAEQAKQELASLFSRDSRTEVHDSQGWG